MAVSSLRDFMGGAPIYLDWAMGTGIHFRHGIWAVALLAVALAPASGGSADEGDEPRLLVLKSGRVMSGRVTRYGDSFVLTRGEGSEATIPERLVDFACGTLDEAYQILRRRIRRSTAARHLQLAEWCLSNGLLARARDQLIEAIAFKPDPASVENFRRRLDVAQRLAVREERKAQDAATAAANAVQQASASAEIAERPRMLVGPSPFEDDSPGADGSEATAEPAPAEDNRESVRDSIQSLTPEAVREFHLKAHPILLSSCATVRCHSAVAQGTSPRLIPNFTGRGAPSPRHANKNLVTVLEFIRTDAPSKSPLLTAATRPHAGDFEGLADRQRDVLVAWVHEAAKRRSQPARSVNPLAARAMMIFGGDEPLETIRPADVRTPLPLETESDPFDPEIFNRRFNRPPPKSVSDR